MMFRKNWLGQKAIYWGNPVVDGYGGFTYNDPVEIDCRWEQRVRSVVNSFGETIISEAQVIVNQDLDIGGVLLLGSFDDYDSSQFNDDPMKISGASKIKYFEKIMDMRGKFFFRRAYL